MFCTTFRRLKRTTNRINPMLLVSASVVIFSSVGSDLFAAGWEPADVAISSAQVQAMAIAPSQPARVYLTARGIGVARSTNRGQSWSPAGVSLPLESSFYSIAVSPLNSDHVFVGSSGEPTPGFGQVHESTDGGQSWTPAGLPLDVFSIPDLLIHANDPDVILAATSGGSSPGIYRSVDGGGNWVLTSGSLGSISVSSLAANPANPNQVLASYSGGAARSTNGGASWTPGLGADSYSDLSWSASDPDVVAAVISGGGIALSDNSGLSFTPVSTPALTVKQVAIDPTNEDVIFIVGAGECQFDGTHAWKSTNRGGTWADIWSPCIGSPSELLIDPISPSNLYVGLNSTFDGFWASTNGGSSWSLKLDGVSSYHSSILKTDPAGGVYSADRLGHLYTLDPALTWSEFNVPFPVFDLEAFAVNHSMPGMILESGVGTFEGDIGIEFAIGSQNYGASWSPDLKQGFPPGLTSKPTLFVSNHAPGQTVYAFSYSTVFRSDDAHASYVEVATGPRIRDAVIDPGNAMRLFGAQNDAPPVLLSEDGAATWTDRSSGLPVAPIVALFMDPGDADRLVVVFNGIGSYESADGGLTWTPHLMTTAVIKDADWDPLTGHLYLATDGDGMITNDPRVLIEGLPTRSPQTVAYSGLHQTVLIGARFSGVYYQDLLDPASVDPIVAAPSLHLSLGPNPTQAGASIQFVLRAAEHVMAAVLDVSGRPVAKLNDRELGAGSHRIDWDGRGPNGETVPSGVYFVQVITESALGTERLLIVR